MTQIESWLGARNRWLATLFFAMVLDTLVFVSTRYQLVFGTRHLVGALLHWPPYAVLFVTMSLCVINGSALHFFFLYRTKGADQRSNAPPHDFHGHLFGVIGVLYAIVLGFVVVTTWQQRDHTEEIVLQEESSVRELFHFLDANSAVAVRAQRFQSISDLRQAMLGSSAQDRRLRTLYDGRQQVLKYIAGMDGEWAQMQNGEELCTKYENEYETQFADPSCVNPKLPLDSQTFRPSAENNSAADCVAAAILEFSLNVAEPEKAMIYQQSLVLLQRFNEARNHRRHHYEEGLQEILWVALLIGGLLTITVPYLGNVDRRHTLARTTALSAMIGLMLALSLVFDHPFTGSTSIDAKSWSGLAENGVLDASDPTLESSRKKGLSWCQVYSPVPPWATKISRLAKPVHSPLVRAGNLAHPILVSVPSGHRQ